MIALLDNLPRPSGEREGTRAAGRVRGWRSARFVEDGSRLPNHPLTLPSPRRGEDFLSVVRG